MLTFRDIKPRCRFEATGTFLRCPARFFSAREAYRLPRQLSGNRLPEINPAGLQRSNGIVSGPPKFLHAYRQIAVAVVLWTWFQALFQHRRNCEVRLYSD